METINHECYVSLEVAKLLKEAGFDWKGVYVYTNGVNELKHYENATVNVFNPIWEFAPTLDVAQRWLRENKDFDINILTDCDSVKRLYYVRYVVKDGHYKTFYITHHQSYTYFNTYEEAQETGIKKALEIILEKGE